MCFEVSSFWCFDVRFSFSSALFSTLLSSIMICVDIHVYLLEYWCTENDDADETSLICWAKAIQYVVPIKTSIFCVFANSAFKRLFH